MNRTYKRIAILLSVTVPLAVSVQACFSSWRKTNPTPAEENISTSPRTLPIDTEDKADAGVDSDFSMVASDYPPSEKEEAALEDPSALDALIASKIGSKTVAFRDDEGGHVETDRGDIGDPVVPAAAENMRLPGDRCLKQLTKHNVSFEKPDFKTPLVETPLLVTGPINGVRIAPMYSGKTPVHAVMDCHLVLALVEVARYARSLGIVAVEFYSTYRPLAEPPEKCPKGRSGKKCRAQKETYEKTARAKTSRHRFASAIDIRQFITEDGGTIDVEADFEKRMGTDPCSYTPTTEKARALSDLVCSLHRNRIFNVILTPNANKAHRNHFHFDVTPGASWVIVR